MIETRDVSSPDAPASSPGISHRSAVVAVHARPPRLPPPVPAACLASGSDGVTDRDRELRAFCRRLLGWSDARAAVIDDAVDGLLASAARRVPIALRGASDLVPVAYALHRRIRGAERPFVVCDRRRREGEGSVRVPPSRPTAMLALEAAMDGSVCLHSNHLPADFDRLCRSLREAVPRATIFVCLHGDDRVRDLLCRPLEIPSLAARASESDRLLQEVLVEAAAALGVADLRLPRCVRQGILARVACFAELEKTALRIVALASTRNSTEAAQRLRMAPISLTRWLGRRGWLVAILRDLDACRDHADD